MNFVLVIKQEQTHKYKMMISFSLLVPTSCYQIRKVYFELCFYMNHPDLDTRRLSVSLTYVLKHCMTNVCVKMQKYRVVSAETKPSV